MLVARDRDDRWFQCESPSPLRHGLIPCSHLRPAHTGKALAMACLARQRRHHLRHLAIRLISQYPATVYVDQPRAVAILAFADLRFTDFIPGQQLLTYSCWEARVAH